MPIAAPAAIEPVRRSFAVLEALNRRRTSTLGELALETGLPKPTLSRLLETLIALGYAARISRQLGYRITDRVLGLSGGIRFVDHLVDAAAPHMRRFTRGEGWPLYLGTISSGAVVVRFSTAPESPMSLDAAGYALRLSPFTGAMGRAYLAFCPEAERRDILAANGFPGGDLMKAGRRGLALAAALERIRRDGYAFQMPPKPRRTHGIGVAIRHGGHVLAAMSLRFTRSAMSEAQAAARFAPALARVAEAIAADVMEAST